MLNLRGFLLSFFLLFQTIFLIAQKSEQIKLSWGKPEKIVIGNEPGIMAPSFINARYLHLPLSVLPSVFKTVALPRYAIAVSASVENVEYSDLTAMDKTLTKGSVFPVTPVPEVSLMREKGKPFAVFSMLPFGIDPSTGRMSKILSFTLLLNIEEDSALLKSSQNYASNSVLSGGDWYKIRTDESGIYKITYNDLRDLGINMNGLNPDLIRIFGNGGTLLNEAAGTARIDDLAENAIKVISADPDVFAQGDYVLFYGKGTRSWQFNPFLERMDYRTHFYDDYAYYFITIGPVPGKRISPDEIPDGEPDFYSNSYTACVVHENDDLNLLKSGRKWFGEKLDYYNPTFNLPVYQFPDLITTEPLIMSYGMAGRASRKFPFTLSLNGVVAAIDSIPRVSGTYGYAGERISTTSTMACSTSLNIKVSFNPPETTSVFWIDFISLNVRCNLRFSGGQLAFRDPHCVGPASVTSFTLDNTVNNLTLWDVSDPVNVKSVVFTSTGSQCTFRRATDKPTEMVAFDGSSFLSVTPVGKIPNQNLHATGDYDMIIITHPDFTGEAQRLAMLHNDIGDVLTLVVPLPEIYNEFSSGTQDITAIRDFMKMLYDRGYETGKPQYLLLFGTASYDLKDRVSGNKNFIPTYQSENSISMAASFLSDDYFGLLDEGEGSNHTSGLLDVASGRLPVRTLDQARTVVDKIEYYLRNPATTHGDWRNTIIVIADDENDNEHLENAEKLTTRIENNHAEFNVEKIYFDAFRQVSTPGGNRFPDVNREIVSRVEKGALLTNYIGHGGEVGWAHERVLELVDINGWTNYDRMGIFFTATCEFSRFDNPVQVSAGELVFLNPNGGAMSMFTTTRLAISATNSRLNIAFIDTVFKTNNGVYPALGDILRYTKNQAELSTSTRNLTLFGDPSMRLPYPKNKVITTLISADTLFANTLATIGGEVRDQSDRLLSGFNGLLNVKVFDKPTNVRTLGQDATSEIVDFKVQKSILYQGKVSVENGKFIFTFPVPRDIDYNFGNGKISYYASDGIEDAHGYCDSIFIGGSSDQLQSDFAGPEIRLFINDTTFKDGDFTGENPGMLAYLFDESGINTAGNGIGHDIVATIDGDSYSSVLMNDYYIADLDSYRSGVVNYQYFNLPDGEHTLTLKAWDVFNNSSSASITFNVKRNLVLSVNEIKAYPNPTSDDVRFSFKHNQFDGTFTVELSIYSLNGELIRLIGPMDVTSEGYVTGNIRWDGHGFSGGYVRNGLYLCRLKVRDRNNHVVSSTVKVVVE